jgi:hypothetical protein
MEISFPARGQPMPAPQTGSRVLSGRLPDWRTALLSQITENTRTDWLGERDSNQHWRNHTRGKSGLYRPQRPSPRSPGHLPRSWQRSQHDTGGKRITAPVTWSDRSVSRNSTTSTVQRRTRADVFAHFDPGKRHPPSSLRATDRDQRRAPLASPRVDHQRIGLQPVRANRIRHPIRAAPAPQRSRVRPAVSCGGGRDYRPIVSSKRA